MRAWPNGWASAFQADYVGSIPIARSEVTRVGSPRAQGWFDSINRKASGSGSNPAITSMSRSSGRNTVCKTVETRSIRVRDSRHRGVPQGDE